MKRRIKIIDKTNQIEYGIVISDNGNEMAGNMQLAYDYVSRFMTEGVEFQVTYEEVDE